MLDKLKDKVLGPKVDIKQEESYQHTTPVEGSNKIFHFESRSNVWSVTISPRNGEKTVTAKFYKETKKKLSQARRHGFGNGGTAVYEKGSSCVCAELYNSEGEKVLACQAPWKEGENFAQNLKSLNISAEGQSPKELMGAEILKKAQGKLGVYNEKENQRSTKKDMSYSR